MKNYLIQFLTRGPCQRFGVVVLLLSFVNRADKAIRQTTGVSLCLQLPGKTILFYLKPTTSRVYRFFEYTQQISLGFLPNRAFSLTWPASMLIYWNKRKHLHEQRVQIPGDFLSTPTWPPFHCFRTPI